MKYFGLAAFLIFLPATPFAQDLKVEVAQVGGLAETEINQFRSILNQVKDFILSRNEIVLKHIPTLEKDSILRLTEQASVVVVVQPVGIHETTTAPALTLISSLTQSEEPSKPVDWTFVVRMKFFDPERTPKSHQLRAITALILEAERKKHGLFDSNHISDITRSEIQILGSSASSTQSDTHFFDFE
jgi:hypothetical protein